MNHKTQGFLLFEFLLTSLLASALLIIVYQSYQTANKGVQYIKNNADFEMQKILLLYQLGLDSMHIVIPHFVYDLYPRIKDYFNKNNSTKETNKEEIDTQKDNNDEIKKLLNKDFKLASIFFPELINTPEEIRISWISSRKILGKNSLVRVNYIFKLTDKSYKEKKLYRLYRREDPLEANYTIKKNGNEYTFITYILNPEIIITMPKIITTEKNPDDDKKNKFYLWNKIPSFTAEKTLPHIDLKNMHKKPLVPFTVFINGTMVAYNFSKELDLQIAISFPIADYALQMFFNNETKIKQNNNLLNDKKDEKNKTQSTKPISEKTIPEKSPIEEANHFNTI